MKNDNCIEIFSSFRDPSGHLFMKDGVLYRSVNFVYKTHYDYAEESGLYKDLIEEGLLITHKEIDIDANILNEADDAYKIISPEKIPFISYPYEWSFSQLKDAALLTLTIQKIALKFEMTLKDASAFNVQFLRGKPIFIDTLSFEKYEEGLPWIGYRQFCQHFFAPLALMSHRDIRLNKLSHIFIDGVPLDFAVSILPIKALFNPFIFSHLYLHAKSQKRFSSKKNTPKLKISRGNLIALIESLESAIGGLAPKKQDTEWQDYYDNTNYSKDAFAEKQKIVSEFLSIIDTKILWDVGSNDGTFSRVASKNGIETISFDIDPVAVEYNYLKVKKENEKNILPLVIDFTNPSPGIGWANNERMSLEERSSADTILALALVHHLAISNNLPFCKIAEYFNKISKHLIIEFIPKEDSQVQVLLATREDIFTDYNEKKFEEDFGKYFLIKDKKRIKDSKRILYLMSKK